MNRTAIAILVWFLVPGQLFAGPAESLEGLLKRAKIVFVGEVSSFEEGKVSLKVGTRLRGDPGNAVLTFTFVPREGHYDKKHEEIPEKGERYFVFSQAGRSSEEPENIIQLGQGMFGNDRRWIMLPIRKHDGVEIVQGGFSFKLETPRKPARGPITLREAIQLVDEEIKAAKKREEMEAFRKLLQELGSRPTTPEHLQALMKIADERDKERAVSAINWLSNFQATPELIAFLNKKSKDPDPRIALEAAIVTTYSGDWSGFDIILGFASNKDPKLRSDAIAQLGAIRFRRYAKRIVPLLLERLRVEKDPEVLDWTIEALGNYPSQLALDAIRPFEKHEDPRVSLRATGVNQTITQELRKKDN